MIHSSHYNNSVFVRVINFVVPGEHSAKLRIMQLSWDEFPPFSHINFVQNVKGWPFDWQRYSSELEDEASCQPEHVTFNSIHVIFWCSSIGLACCPVRAGDRPAIKPGEFALSLVVAGTNPRRAVIRCNAWITLPFSSWHFEALHVIAQPKISAKGYRFSCFDRP